MPSSKPRLIHSLWAGMSSRALALPFENFRSTKYIGVSTRLTWFGDSLLPFLRTLARRELGKRAWDRNAARDGRPGADTLEPRAEIRLLVELESRPLGREVPAVERDIDNRVLVS